MYHRYRHLYDNPMPLFVLTKELSTFGFPSTRLSFRSRPAFWTVIQEAWDTVLVGNHYQQHALLAFENDAELVKAVDDFNIILPNFYHTLSSILEKYPVSEQLQFDNKIMDLVDTLDVPEYQFLAEGRNADRAPECWVIAMGWAFYRLVLAQPHRFAALTEADLDGTGFASIVSELQGLPYGGGWNHDCSELSSEAQPGSSPTQVFQETVTPCTSPQLPQTLLGGETTLFQIAPNIILRLPVRPREDPPLRPIDSRNHSSEFLQSSNSLDPPEAEISSGSHHLDIGHLERPEPLHVPVGADQARTVVEQPQSPSTNQ